MLVTLLDANSEPHVVAWRGQDQIDDASGVLNAQATGVNPVPQPVAPANEDRAGFLFQNTSEAAMTFYESGTAAAGWAIPPYGYFPPNDSFPIPTGEIFVAGTLISQTGDSFTYREWVNGADE